MQSPLLELPYIMPSQAQKHVTHNEALRRLDACVQLSVATRSLAEPPPNAAEGARFLVAAPGNGEWSSRAGMVAAFQDGAWAFLSPRAGWLAYVEDEETLLLHDGADWKEAFDAVSGPGDRLGVNAEASGVNRFAVRSHAALFDHEGSSHRLAINKAGAQDTASLLFQEGYSGRAEIGLAGSGGFALKTSADGTAWADAMRADPASGRMTFPGGAGGIAIPIMGNSGANISAGQTRFMSPGLTGASALNVYVPVPVAGRFTGLNFATSGSPGVGESWTLTLQNLFSDTALTCTILAGTNQAFDNANSVHFTARQRWCLKIVSSAGAANTGNVLFSLLFVPD